MRRNDSRLWPLVAAYVTAMAIGAGSIIYTNVQDHKLCGLLVTLNKSYQENPPTTPTGKAVAASIMKLDEDYGCEG